MKINNKFLQHLGLQMMNESPKFKDDIMCNNYSRIGDMLTHIGTPYSSIRQFRDLSKTDLEVVRHAIVYFKENIDA